VSHPDRAPADAEPRKTLVMTSASTTVIALLRGINVGGHNKLPMAQLRDIATDVGFNDVRTYIQSGNLVASTDLEPEQAGDVLAAAIREVTGLQIPIVVRTAQQWADVIAANPFPDAPDPGTRVHVVFLSAPSSAAIQAFDASGFAPELLEVVGSEIYLHLPDGMGRSRLAVAVNRLPDAAAGTARNWNTVLRIAGLVGTA
jgi:uncharacterized protein (DUF1697 family)